ncbi:VOC family protein [Ectopseudomonas chengduensis]|jgi:2,3-dihydroxy-p-cumate/2,3-dihydroxybenzoate 3,4-dioxygenase|nr:MULTISPECIES: VOC family protein [Pseudomonas]MBJ7547914.1 VOC family protein [Pseudomonas sp. OA3]UZT77701.1 VOC family protein [Pseudomonas chengduensis]WFS17998.1 VOC family protein [Pseudomonas sp. 905_Psudmo1]
MINLHDICYLRLGCHDLDEMVRFATGILGLELRERTATHAYLRGDSSAFNLCYIQGDASYDVSAFELRHLAELKTAESELATQGIEVNWGTPAECEERRVEAFVAFTDPNDNRIELVYRPHQTGVRYFPARDAGITEFGHFGLHSRNIERDLLFWTSVLSARVSDKIGDGALLRIDEVHHKIALFPSDKIGVQHVNFQVASIDDVMRSWYFLQERGVPIAFGPGRHPTSTAMFIYFLGPDGRVYEYSSGVKRITDEASYTPRQFEMKPSSFCMWGAKPNVEEFSE